MFRGTRIALAATLAAALAAPAAVAHADSTFAGRPGGVSDFSGDGFADVLGIDASGRLLYYPHNGGRLDGPITFGRFERAVRHLAVADWSGDGHADLLVVDATSGELRYVPNQGGQPVLPGQLIGVGFASMRHVVAADWSGDGHADVISSDDSGNLWYYPHQGNVLGAAQLIGTGWGGFQNIL